MNNGDRLHRRNRMSAKTPYASAKRASVFSCVCRLESAASLSFSGHDSVNFSIWLLADGVVGVGDEAPVFNFRAHLTSTMRCRLITTTTTNNIINN